MSDASDTIRRRKERTLYASRVIQDTYAAKGYTQRKQYDGTTPNRLITYPVYHDMRDGTTETTEAERSSYVDSVPNREPDPPTDVIVTGASGEATVYFKAPVYTGVFPITQYIVKVSPGGLEFSTTSSPYVIGGLESGVQYVFTVYAVNAAGRSLSSVPTDPVTVIGLPAVPTNLVGTPGNAQVSVAFNESAFDGGAPILEYTVVSDPDNVAAIGTESPIVVTGLTNGVSYTFTAYATNANGASNDSSASAAAVPFTVPDPPTNVTGVRGNQSVTVNFLPPLNNGGSEITEYRVTSSPGDFFAIGAGSPLVVTGLTNGTPYTFTAIATNDAGNSVASVVSTAVTPATVPDAPTSVSAVAGNTQAVVSFTAPVSNGGSTITSYTVTSSPGEFTATGGGSPITITGLTNGVAYTFTVVATNAIGISVASSASNSVTPISAPVPGVPTNVSAVPGNTQATVSFTAPANPGGSPITSYKVTANPGGFFAIGSGSPLTVTGLTNGVAYTFSVVATNLSGDSNPGISNVITAGTPLAPVLTSLFPTVNDITVSFTQAANGTPAISNYRYSLNDGPFVSLSPADATNPVVIAGLTGNTSYSIRLRAINANGDGLVSNTLSVNTFTTMHIASFTDVGATSWTAPAGVTFVQYMVIAGGGGGGACYSDIEVIGDVPLANTAPSPTAFWINTQPGYILYGYLFKGNMRYNSTKPTQLSVLSLLGKVPPTITPNQTTYVYNKFYADQIVYSRFSLGLPGTTNYFPPYIINGTRCNNISGGGGGGAAGQIKVITGTSIYTVVPGTSYTVTVGDGGAGGTASAGVESIGDAGGNSVFDSIISAGGSGGSGSRGGYGTNGYGKGGYGGQSSGNFFSGFGGQGLSAPQSNYGYYNSAAPGGSGAYLNFDGTGGKSYVNGGPGGVPNTVATVDTIPNRGFGGSGTGATLNSFANGRKGGSGLVMLKWYT